MPRPLLLVSLLALGCAPGVEYEPRDFVCAEGEEPPCETSEFARPGGWVGRGPRAELDGETRRYVLSWISIPQPADGRVVGFNLDGLSGSIGQPEGGPCERAHDDYVSSVDPGHVGVDNVIGAEAVEVLDGLISSDVELCPNGADGCLDERLRASIASGQILLLLTISGLDSLRFDPSVTLELAAGAVPEGAELELDPDGRIAPDQRFDVERVWSTAEGDIFDGRLRATGLEYILASAAADWLSPRLQDAELRFDLSERGLHAGAIGGLLSVEELSAPWLSIETTLDVFAILDDLADVGPSDTRAVCNYISFGAEFEAVPAH